MQLDWSRLNIDIFRPKIDGFRPHFAATGEAMLVTSPNHTDVQADRSDHAGTYQIGFETVVLHH